MHTSFLSSRRSSRCAGSLACLAGASRTGRPRLKKGKRIASLLFLLSSQLVRTSRHWRYRACPASGIWREGGPSKAGQASFPVDRDCYRHFNPSNNNQLWFFLFFLQFDDSLWGDTLPKVRWNNRERDKETRDWKPEKMWRPKIG
jgi:hypothetical protein